MGDKQEETRGQEWYAPRFGPPRFRTLVGLTFLPYTLMNASYVLIGSLLAPAVHYDRMWSLVVVYIIAVGVSAHALDATGPNRPWGAFLSKNQLLSLAVCGLAPALVLGVYLALTYAPLLLPLGALELFFLLSYNLELFGGSFHKDVWFGFSWGFLPVVAGYVVQTDAVSLASLGGGLFGFFTALVEISASRPYKALKKDPQSRDSPLAVKFERILKSVVAAVLSTALLLLLQNLSH